MAVKDISFAVNEGEILGLIGPNGAGKTTVFNLITGFYKPTSGSVLLWDRDVRQLKPAEIVRIGVARTFQNIRLFENLTALDNVRTVLYRKAKYGFAEALLRTPAVKRSEEDIYRTAMAYLEEVGLAGKAKVRAMELPYGLQRRLELARALATEPKLLLLDEPAAGMNPEESSELVDLIRSVQRKYALTVILVEHHMDVVMSLCQRIVVMNFGRMLREGSPGEIQADPEVIRAYLGEEFVRARRG